MRFSYLKELKAFSQKRTAKDKAERLKHRGRKYLLKYLLHRKPVQKQLYYHHQDRPDPDAADKAPPRRNLPAGR